jgi:ribosomal protein RSM22 (predicted rRNA methylase)
MNPPRVDPVSPRVLALIDAVAAAELRAHDLSGAALAAAVRRVSEAYRRQGGSPADLRGDRAALCARLRFFLPRDLPKIQAPLAELTAAAAFPRARTLRVLDVGAGLGTTGLGTALFALEHAGVERVQVDAFDRDAAALALASRVAKRAASELGLALELTTFTAALGPALLERARGPYHLIVLGFVLNELGDEQADAVEHHRLWLARLCELLAPDGALIVLEPALRAQSRTLQEVRGRFAAAGGPPYVFAPCLHRDACPLLERERDWCHEQLPLALPSPLDGIARAAGLRTEDLSFSYLTLHRAARSLAELDAGARLLRVVSAPLRSKGKLEVAVCGPTATRKLRRLDRHASSENRALGGVHRGAVLRLPACAEEPITAQGAAAPASTPATRSVDAETRVEVVLDVCPHA